MGNRCDCLLVSPRLTVRIIIIYQTYLIYFEILIKLLFSLLNTN